MTKIVFTEEEKKKIRIWLQERRKKIYDEPVPANIDHKTINRFIDELLEELGTVKVGEKTKE